jgi:hypothetical protein
MDGVSINSNPLAFTAGFTEKIAVDVNKNLYLKNWMDFDAPE